MKPGIEAVLIEVLGVYEVPWKRSALESQITLFYFLTYSFCINELICPVIVFDMWFPCCCTQSWTKLGERKLLSGSNSGRELSSYPLVQNGPGQTLELDIQALAQQKIQIRVFLLQIGVGGGELQALPPLHGMCNLGNHLSWDISMRQCPYASRCVESLKHPALEFHPLSKNCCCLPPR